MIPDDIPWSYVLPALVLIAFGFGLVWKRLQDKTVQVVRDTLKPGDLHVDELQEYVRRRQKKAA